MQIREPIPWESIMPGRMKEPWLQGRVPEETAASVILARAYRSDMLKRFATIVRRLVYEVEADAAEGTYDPDAFLPGASFNLLSHAQWRRTMAGVHVVPWMRQPCGRTCRCAACADDSWKDTDA